MSLSLIEKIFFICEILGICVIVFFWMFRLLGLNMKSNVLKVVISWEFKLKFVLIMKNWCIKGLVKIFWCMDLDFV